MPRRCTVCDHPQIHSIDETLVTGAPYRSVARRFGLSESSVYRHKTEHLPAQLLKAREVEEVAQTDDLLEQVRHLQAHALDILERAEKVGDLRTALSAISQARVTIVLVAVRGRLQLGTLSCGDASRTGRTAPLERGIQASGRPRASRASRVGEVVVPYKAAQAMELQDR